MTRDHVAPRRILIPLLDTSLGYLLHELELVVAYLGCRAAVFGDNLFAYSVRTLVRIELHGSFARPWVRERRSVA